MWCGFATERRLNSNRVNSDSLSSMKAGDGVLSPWAPAEEICKHIVDLDVCFFLWAKRMLVRWMLWLDHALFSLWYQLLICAAAREPSVKIGLVWFLRAQEQSKLSIVLVTEIDCYKDEISLCSEFSCKGIFYWLERKPRQINSLSLKVSSCAYHLFFNDILIIDFGSWMLSSEV